MRPASTFFIIQLLNSREYLETGREKERPSLREICGMILRHASMQAEFKGEAMAMREMRKHVAWYTAGCPHSSALREAVNHVETYAGLEQLLKEWLASAE